MRGNLSVPVPLPDADARQRRIILQTVYVALAAYLVVLAVGLLIGDPGMYIPAAASLVLLLLPAWLIQRQRIELAGIVLELILLVTLTLLATLGNGFFDIAVMAFPAVIVFAGLAMRRSAFYVSVGATCLAVAWLVFGADLGLYAAQPPEVPDWSDFLIGLMVVLATGFAVSLLAGNIRHSLALAHEEIERRRVVEEQLRQFSLFDLMTGIHNRNFFEQELVRLENGRNYPISVVVADLDGLKVLNDTVGHQAGDEMLKEAAALLKSVLRAEDILARVGGDEFAVLLPRTDAETVGRVVDRIHEKVDALAMGTGGDGDVEGEGRTVGRTAGAEGPVDAEAKGAGSEGPAGAEAKSAGDMSEEGHAGEGAVIRGHANEGQLPPVRLSIGSATAELSDLLGAFTLADRRMYEDKARRRGKG